MLKMMWVLNVQSKNSLLFVIIFLAILIQVILYSTMEKDFLDDLRTGTSENTPLEYQIDLEIINSLTYFHI